MTQHFRDRTRPLRHGVAYLALRILMGLLNQCPHSLVLRIGSLLGMLIGPFARRDDETMRRNLASCFEQPPENRRCWADLGRRGMELLSAQRSLKNFRISPEAEMCFQEAQAAGRGILVATAHLGNWELMAGALAAQGYSIFAIRGRVPRSPLGRWLQKQRTALGVETAGVGRGARQALRRLREGGSVALFVDQTTNERTRLVQFMGRPTSTPTTYERLLRLSSATPLFVWNIRGSDGNYVINAEKLPSDVAPLDWLSARISSIVTDQPLQWVWIHDRWKTSTGR